MDDDGDVHVYTDTDLLACAFHTFLMQPYLKLGANIHNVVLVPCGILAHACL